MLSHPDKRAVYDQDRWLSGRFKKDAAALTPAYILLELEKLQAHLATVDVYRMNKQLLKDYLLFLLSDEKAALMAQSAGELTARITAALLRAVDYLPHYFSLPVLRRMRQVLANHTAPAQLIDARIARMERETRLRKLYPWLIVVITLLILCAMYFFGPPRK